MGNCQATDVVAAAIIQHPNGSHETLYWPTTAGELMRSHPGHHVALVTFHISSDVLNTSNTTEVCAAAAGGSFRLIRVRLLKHKDLLLVGQVYRLVTSQEVAKALQARKHERHMKAQAELMKQQEQQQNRQRQQQSSGKAVNFIKFFHQRDKIIIKDASKLVQSGVFYQIRSIFNDGKEREGEAEELPSMAAFVAEHLRGWNLNSLKLRVAVREVLQLSSISTE